jgi:CBS domain-containing protein
VSVELLHKVQAIAKRISPERSALTILKQAGAGGTRDGVLTVSPEDRLRDVLITMAASDFSQVPAFDGQRLVGLLTAERVLLHIATSLTDSDEELALIDTSVLVADVIGAIVPCPCFPIDATPSDILAAFRQTEKSGDTIHAAVISHSGVDTEKPLAIVCAADLPLFT